MYIGRFAPSPTGPLHFGSFLTAVASFLDARSKRGLWRLRIDDLDGARNRPGSVSKILRILETAGLVWDGPVLYQSQLHEEYQQALARLDKQGLLYACTCSRKFLRDQAGNASPDPVYPGFCRNLQQDRSQSHALRIRAPNTSVSFIDRLQGHYSQQIAREVGDFILKRRDQVIAYQLAVVIDDATQGVNQVVRGLDLLESTPLQIYLHRLLDLRLPEYCHVPIVVDRKGQKLSKQSRADAVEEANLARVIRRVLEMLNHPPPPGLASVPAHAILEWGIENWNLEKLSKQRKEFRLLDLRGANQSSN